MWGLQNLRELVQLGGCLCRARAARVIVDHGRFAFDAMQDVETSAISITGTCVRSHNVRSCRSVVVSASAKCRAPLTLALAIGSLPLCWSLVALVEGVRFCFRSYARIKALTL